MGDTEIRIIAKRHNKRSVVRSRRLSATCLKNSPHLETLCSNIKNGIILLSYYGDISSGERILSFLESSAPPVKSSNLRHDIEVALLLKFLGFVTLAHGILESQM